MYKKVAVITGGSKGIGRQLGDIFLKEGYAVVNASRNPPEKNIGSVFIKTTMGPSEKII